MNNLQPYQKASQEIVRQSKAPGKLLKEGVGLASTAIGGGAILSRVLPLLNKFVPDELASKGLEKVDPRLGKFFKGVFSKGFTVKDGLDYLRKKFLNNNQEEEEIDMSIPEQNTPNPMEENRQQTLGKFNQKIKKPGLADEEMQRFQNHYGQQNENPQTKQVDEALIAALDKILKM